MHFMRYTDKWNDFGRGRNGLGDQQLIHGHRQQHGDTQRNLFAGFRRQTEDEDADAHQQDARKDEIVRKEHRFTSQHDRVSDVDVRFHAARISLHVPASRRSFKNRDFNGKLHTLLPLHFAESLLLHLEPEIVLPLAENRRYSRTHSIFHKLHKHHFELPISVELQHAKSHVIFQHYCTRT